MTKIVLDTNVLISATFWKGPPNQVTVLAASGRITHCTSKEILDEYAKILERDFHQTKEQIEEKLSGITSFSKIFQPSIKLDIVKDDPTDNKILETALEANAQYIVSGDRHLLKLREFKGIRIVKAKELLDIIM